MDDARRERLSMDLKRDFEQDMDTAVRFGHSTIQSHLESRYANEAPPVQARSLMVDNDDQFPAAQLVLVQLERRATVADPRPRVDARRGYVTLPMPAFEHANYLRHLESVRRGEGGAPARGGVAGPSKTPRDKTGRKLGARERQPGQGAKAKEKGVYPDGPDEGDWKFINASTGAQGMRENSHEYLRQLAASGHHGLKYNERYIHRASDNIWLPLRAEPIKPSEMCRPNEETQQMMEQVLDDSRWEEDEDDDMEEKEEVRAIARPFPSAPPSGPSPDAPPRSHLPYAEPYRCGWRRSGT